MRPRILVTGASGFLGWTLCQQAQPEWDVQGLVHQGDSVPPGTTLTRADLLDEQAAERLLDECSPDAIVHLAAVANTGQCERDPMGSRPLNVGVPERLAGLCKARGIPFAFSSTDMVFAGTAAPYTEADERDPICEYGRQKAEAERRVLQAYPRALVCRLPLMFGMPSPRSGSFLSSLLEGLRAGTPLRLFTDEFRTMADAQSVSQGILALLGNASRIYHLGGPERVSRYEFGLLVAKHFSLSPNGIIPTSQADVPLACPRPPDVSLDSTRARLLGYSPRPLEAALRELAEALSPLS